MSAEECGRIVARGIAENRAYIVTHPEVRPLVEAQQRALLADIEAEARARSSAG